MAEPPLNSTSSKERLSQVRGREVSSGVREQTGGRQQGSLPNLGETETPARPDLLDVGSKSDSFHQRARQTIEHR